MIKEIIKLSKEILLTQTGYDDLVKELDVYKNGKIIYFIDNSNVWYTASGGVQALDTMLTDLENALLNK